MTLTFDLYVILIGQGRRFHTRLSDGCMSIGSKVVSVFIE